MSGIGNIEWEEEWVDIEEFIDKNGDNEFPYFWIYTKYILLAFNIILAAFIIFKTRASRVHRANDEEKPENNVAIIISHPDDEAMFFAPVIKELKEQNRNIYLLCLSTGNFYGLGKVREKELIKSCEYLGIKRDNVEFIDHPELQDGQNNDWPADVISPIISDFIKKTKCNTILTFDQYGVSSHINHISTYRGVVKFHKESKEKVRVFTLQSTNILRKYIGPFDIVFSIWNPSFYFSILPVKSYYSMRAHYSQFVWFRRLFVIFSRYGYINTFDEVEKDE